ncbi:MAG: hypothetical protein P8J79_09555 [Halioglobus sp.]|nr:hypothetical protein [Halioglobus sp.]
MTIKKWSTVSIPLVLATLFGCNVVMSDELGSNDSRQFTFAWPYADNGDMAPRGGSSRGAPIELAKSSGEQWARLRAPNLTDKERDRLAILAMAGPYRASFDFIETVGFTEEFVPTAPYQSWGTEYVHVVADEPDFISLQHIMVIRFDSSDYASAEPVVIKHWRQDWRYEQRRMHTFRGNSTWRLDKQSRSESRGRWVQSVYQVDDSPRYMAAGRWQHRANFSSWTSDETWRPLPRREFSVRDDYDVLIGTNRHTITPSGWVQEEFNLKAVLDDDGMVSQVLARENGVARYERIQGYDWHAGDEYWKRTAAFWAMTRDVWANYLRDESAFSLQKTHEGVPLYAAMFEMADNLEDANPNSNATRDAIKKMLQRYMGEG